MRWAQCASIAPGDLGSYHDIDVSNQDVSCFLIVTDVIVYPTGRCIASLYADTLSREERFANDADVTQVIDV